MRRSTALRCGGCGCTDLRHSFGPAMAGAGTPMRALMELMGHATMRTTLIDADDSPDHSGGVEHASPGVRGPWFSAWF